MKIYVIYRKKKEHIYTKLLKAFYKLEDAELFLFTLEEKKFQCKKKEEEIKEATEKLFSLFKEDKIKYYKYHEAFVENKIQLLSLEYGEEDYFDMEEIELI